jgi:YtkA-like
VHVRVAPSHGGRRLTVSRRNRLQTGLSVLLLILCACWLGGACHRQAQARDLTFESNLSPRRPAVGPALLELHVLDATGRPVVGAHLRIEAQMSHPGMAPFLATATERGNGVYEAALRFTMAGDWIVLVTGSLSNGDRVEYRIEIPGVRPA